MKLFSLISIIYCCVLLSDTIVVNCGTLRKIRNTNRKHHNNSENIFHIPQNQYYHENLNKTYIAMRDNLISDETELRLGGKLFHNFTNLECRVHKILLKYRQHEMDIGIENSSANLAGLHFFQAKEAIERSPIFKIIQKMPKGAALHGHNTAMVSSDWILNNLTYRENLRMCNTSGRFVLFTFKIDDARCVDDLVLVADRRENATSVDVFDAELRMNFDLYSPENIRKLIM